MDHKSIYIHTHGKLHLHGDTPKSITGFAILILDYQKLQYEYLIFQSILITPIHQDF
jgi:hypothetical protein